MRITNGESRREFLKSAALGGLCAGAPPPSGPREYQRGGMVYRRLGRTEVDVSLLSFGSHTDPADKLKSDAGGSVLTAEGQARRDRIIARAFDLGVNLLDVYENEGQLEPAARIVQGRRHKVLISLAHNVTAKGIDRAARLYGHIDLFRFHTAAIDDGAFRSWDLLRKAREAGKVRVIGIATHIETTMVDALAKLDGLDYLFFPYNFIHARADYSLFLPAALQKGVGLIAMKPLAQGSIVALDTRARAGAAPESSRLQLWQKGSKPILPAAVAELTKTLNRLPDETLCMAAMRFVYGRRFLSTAITGMFDGQYLEDNYQALTRYQETSHEERAALKAARRVARLTGGAWLPPHYRWLEEQWRA